MLSHKKMETTKVETILFRSNAQIWSERINYLWWQSKQWPTSHSGAFSGYTLQVLCRFTPSELSVSIRGARGVKAWNRYTIGLLVCLPVYNLPFINICSSLWKTTNKRKLPAIAQADRWHCNLKSSRACIHISGFFICKYLRWVGIFKCGFGVFVRSFTFQNRV